MRICMVTTFYPPYHFGGDGVFVYHLSHALANRGHQVDVVHSVDAYRLLGEAGPVAGYPGHANVTPHGLSTPMGATEMLATQQAGRPFLHRRALKQLLASPEFDLIHFHNVSLMGAPAVFRYGHALKFFTIHEHWLVCPMHILWRFDQEVCEERTCIRCQLHGNRPPQLWRSTPLLKRCARAIDLFLAPSEFTRDKHRELGFEGPIQHLPHFVVDPPPTPAKPAERPYFLFAGRLEKAKAPDLLIRAFRRFRDADLVLAGDGDERDNLERSAYDLPHVRFVGRLAPAELTELYASAIAVLVPSSCFEVFGLTAVEGFATGTPAIVRDRGSLPELIEQSGAGIVFRTEAELIESLHRMVTEPALCEALSQRARASYLAHWTERVHVERYEALYEERRRGPR
jgi:glycosyltransferase involved in cell wall biosynthesis